MLERLKQQIKLLLKIPAQPEAPFGVAGSVRVFHAAPGFFYYRMLAWFFRQLSVLVGILVVLWFVSVEPGDTVQKIEDQLNEQGAPLEQIGISLSIVDIWALFEMLAIAGFFLQLPFTFLMVFLDYEYRWYIITDRSLRIREGLMSVEERTMTFSNIQNVSIRQGPLQRVFGISDLEVSTAGGGGTAAGKHERDQQGKNLHRGYFRGIDNASEIRDAILVHLRSLRVSGLGDPEEESKPGAWPELDAAAVAGEMAGAAAHDKPRAGPEGAPRAGSEYVPRVGPEDVLSAARGVLDEARALRQALG